MSSNTVLRVVHSTGYQYDGGVTASFNEARMTPVSNEEQTVMFSRMDITPAAWTHTYTDYWGTTVTGFELHQLHDDLRVVSTSTVDVHRRPDPDRSASWETLRSARITSEYAEFLDAGPLVAPHPELAELIGELAARSATPAGLVDEARDLVAERIRYLPGVTSVKTTADEVWTKGAGVCQDLSHLLIGALRLGGVPTRYVSGYLVAEDASDVDQPTTGESHAWVEYWAGTWIGLDPTNRGEVGNDHVVVGHGRDYSDVAPLRGVFTGGPATDMFVEVAITRLR